MSKDKKIIIIGAGVAGLVAAIELEKKGYAPKIIEASDRVGGRVKTDYEDGYQFDHGFQVLLTAYPEVNTYLDMDKLQLKRFNPGAMIHTYEKTFLLSDPLRQPSTLLKAIFSPAGSLLDKWKIWRLTNKLKKMTIEEIFNSPSQTTISYLQHIGLSHLIITNFFKPFFSGIFLEKNLETSARMFQFIFKMFSEGYAAIPEKGMQAIPDQLYAQLTKSEILFNTSVTGIGKNTISTDKGDHSFDAVIIANDPCDILSHYDRSHKDFQHTVNLYYSIPKQERSGYISLVPGENAIINNYCVISGISLKYAPSDKSLLSVTLVGVPKFSDKELVKEVSAELLRLIDVSSADLKHLKTFMIPKALPIVKDPAMQLSREEVYWEHGIYLAGDYLLGGSLNGAMLSGRRSAEELVADMQSS